MSAVENINIKHHRSLYSVKDNLDSKHVFQEQNLK